ncbi:MAG: cytochrome ubiquinol oxidase subunit I [Wenzhouxiangellaceae bacterium]
MESLIWSRLQFAFTVSYHILFPTLSIGLALLLVWLEWRWLRSDDESYRTAYRFWSRIFALTFGMGVVSGIVLSYEFGTNFAAFSAAAGNIIGPLMSYEVITAFFLEASFLGIMLFGWKRVSRRLHFFATAMVAAGTLISAFWILSANSWMHTPAGFELRDGVFYPQDWWAIVFNPSFPYRFTHMILASFLATTFFVAGIAGWQQLRQREALFATRHLRLALLTAAILAPLQVLVGDLHGLNTEVHQPMKVAAMEGRWETTAHAPLLLFAWPDQQAAMNHWEIGIPSGASLVLKHSADGVVKGLDQVEAADRPAVGVVFFAFRVMVGLGLLFIVSAWLGLWLQRGRRSLPQWFLRWLVVLTPAGFVATIAGWWVAEVGRQPWLVHGQLRTAEGISLLPAAQVQTSLLAFVLLYSGLFTAFLWYLCKIIRVGPSQLPPISETQSPATHQQSTPARPAFGAMSQNLED